MISPTLSFTFLVSSFCYYDSSSALTAFSLNGGVVTIVNDCLSHILSRNVTAEGEAVIIFPLVESTHWNWTEEPTVIMKEEADEGEIRYDMRKGDIVYIFSDLPMASILDKVSWRSTTKFVVYNRNASKESILSLFWERRIVHVVILQPNFLLGSVSVFTYFPYSERHCEHLGEAVLLGNCHAVHEFFPEKVADLHGCPLIITLVERSPAVINDNGVADGVETDILKMIAESVNATPMFYFLKGRLRFYRSNGNSILLELLENRSHIVAGSLIYTESMHLMSDGVEYPVTMCMTVIVPRVTRPTYLHILVNIIPGKILAGVAINVALGIFCCYAFLRVFDRRTTLKTAARQVIYFPQKKFYYLTIRVFLAVWLLASFLLNAVFDASVSSAVLAPKPLPQMESLEDVFRNDLLLDGDTFMMKEVLRSYLPRRRKNDICGCTLKKALTLIAEEGDRAFIDIKFNVMYNLMKLPRISQKIHIPEKCILTFRPVIQLRKHSPFLKMLRNFMLSLSESGIIEKSFDTYNRKIKEQRTILRERMRRLTLYDFEGSFLLLLFGLASSTVAFLLELCFFTILPTVNRSFSILKSFLNPHSIK